MSIIIIIIISQRPSVAILAHGETLRDIARRAPRLKNAMEATRDTETCQGKGPAHPPSTFIQITHGVVQETIAELRCVCHHVALGKG